MTAGDMDQAATTFPEKSRSSRLEWAIVAIALGLTVAAYASPLALAVLLGAVVLCLAAVRFKLLLVAVVFFLPLNPYLSWNLPIKDLGTLVRLCLFAGVFVAHVRSGESLRKWLFSGRPTRVVLLYFGVAVASSVLFNPPTSSVAHELMRFVSYLCLYYTVTDWLRTDNDFESVCKALLLSTIITAVFGFYQFLVGDYTSLYDALYPIQDEALKNPPWSGRITSFISHFNTLAGYLNMVIPMCIVWGIRTRDTFTRTLCHVCFFFASIALLLTQSRGGLIAYVGILLLSAYLLPPTRSLRVSWIALVMVSSVLGAVVAGLIFKRLSGVDTFTEVTRLAIWAGAALIFMAHPLAGVGYGNFKLVLANTIDVPEGFMLDAHNLYMELLAETGVLGFVAFMVLVFTYVRRGLRMFRRSSNIMDVVIGFTVVAGILGVMIHGAVDYLFHNSPQVAALFFLLLALLNARELHRNSGGAQGDGVMPAQS